MINIVDQSILAEQLVSEIRKYKNVNNVDGCIEYVNIFENMFNDVIDKEGRVDNKFITNLMSLMCSDDFLNAIGRDKDERHIILDAYLLSICKILYSNLDLVELFDSAEKYYS